LVHFSNEERKPEIDGWEEVGGRSHVNIGEKGSERRKRDREREEENHDWILGIAHADHGWKARLEPISEENSEKAGNRGNERGR
jgi:DNA-binding PadR family transcriptional regulator